jgi:WD40 repeat protein
MNAWIAHEGSTVRAIAHGPNGNTIVTGGGDGVIRVWHLVEEQTVDGFRNMNRQELGIPRVTPILVAELRGHTSAVVSLSTGCPGRLVSGAHDGTIRVWDLDVKPPPKVANIKAVRRDARYAVLGHTIWLGGTYADAERIICDGANNVLLEYDFSNAPQDV